MLNQSSQNNPENLSLSPEVNNLCYAVGMNAIMAGAKDGDGNKIGINGEGEIDMIGVDPSLAVQVGIKTMSEVNEEDFRSTDKYFHGQATGPTCEINPFTERSASSRVELTEQDKDILGEWSNSLDGEKLISVAYAADIASLDRGVSNVITALDAARNGATYLYIKNNLDTIEDPQKISGKTIRSLLQGVLNNFGLSHGSTPIKYADGENTLLHTQERLEAHCVVFSLLGSWAARRAGLQPIQLTQYTHAYLNVTNDSKVFSANDAENNPDEEEPPMFIYDGSKRRWHQIKFKYPESIQPHYNLAVVYSNLSHFLGEAEKFDLAEAIAARATELDPENIAALSNHGDSLRALRRYSESEQKYIKALKNDPENPMILRAIDALHKSKQGDF